MTSVSSFFPEIQSFPYEDAVYAVRVLCAEPGSLLLASEPFSEDLQQKHHAGYIQPPSSCYPINTPVVSSSRWSIFAFDPVAVFGKGESGFLEDAEKTWKALHHLGNKACDLPFSGGFAGLLSYEAAGRLENLPEPPGYMKNWPDVWLGLYDGALCLDHTMRKAFLTSWGGFQTCFKTRQKRTQTFFDKFSEAVHTSFHLRARLKIPPHPQSSPKAYADCLKAILAYIRAGDLYQANFSQAFEASLEGEQAPYAVFERLIKQSPAPFSAYLRLDAQHAVATHTPERFFSLNEKGEVTTSPVKGTRPRGRTEEEDRQLSEDLLKSPKDRAENLMIVDLMRHDLSRVCKPGTVRVSDLFGLKRYPSVQHLVSTLHGQICREKNVFDLLRATFPPGSVTGAPKIRAMEVIAELEGNARGPYCGAMGYIGLDGRADFNVMIRSLAFHRPHKNWQCIFRAGGGIIADSHIDEEYQETLFKAQALQNALESF